jgi:ABC-type polysaccharide/polyol phosphate export permease
MSTITLNPLAIAAGLARHRYLLGQLVKRDVLLRYRGAMFGVLWIFISPLLMFLSPVFHPVSAANIRSNLRIVAWMPSE